MIGIFFLCVFLGIAVAETNETMSGTMTHMHMNQNGTMNAEMNAKMANMMLCNMMPFMVGCGFRKECMAGGILEQFNQTSLACDPLALFKFTCMYDTGMSNMGGCKKYNETLDVALSGMNPLMKAPTSFSVQTNAVAVCAGSPADVTQCGQCTSANSCNNAFQALSGFCQSSHARGASKECDGWSTFCCGADATAASNSTTHMHSGMHNHKRADLAVTVPMDAAVHTMCFGADVTENDATAFCTSVAAMVAENDSTTNSNEENTGSQLFQFSIVQLILISFWNLLF